MRLASGTLLTSLALVALPRAGAAQTADSGGRAAATGAAQAPTTGDSATASSATPAPLDADSIAARAIARRHAALAAFQHVSYDAFVKLVARDFRRPADSTGSVVFISEKRSTAYWEHHRRYQETVTAQRQTRAFEVPRSLVAVDDILDVERSHIGLATYTSAERAGGSERGRSGRGRTAASGYSVLSPFARSAPESYAYQLLDTVNVDGRRVFRLAVIPRSSATPLFVGTVEVVDSTFDPVAVDLGVNEGVQFTSVTNLRYQERLHDVGGGRWMPYEIRLAGEVRPKITVPGVPRTIAGVPVPGLPERLAFEQVALLDDYAFDQGDEPSGLGEYRVVVRDGADRPDRVLWDTPPAVPLTVAESTAWERADSIGRNPPFLVRVGESVGAVVRVVAAPGFFHYNRVDGYYLGAAHDWRVGPGAAFTTRAGYALGSEVWQYRVGGQVRLSEAQRLWVGAWYHDETVAHPTLISSEYNPTFRAVFARVDPLDYYRERGVSVSLGMKLLNLTRLDLGYDDARQTSLDTLPGYSFSSSRYPPRGNLPIADGHLRSVSAALSYDSREFLRNRGEDYRLSAPSWTRISVGVEAAAPSVIADDFSYRRYTLQLERAQPLLGFGTTTVSATGGIATGPVPPQRYFTVDFGQEFLAVEGSGFTTLERTNYYGTRAAVLTVRHDFGRLLFARSGLPLIRRLPFSLSLFGGVFWTSFAGHAPYPGDTTLATAPSPYREVGVALGNLTPFLSPFNLSVHFAWQLSAYPTRRFRFGFGLTGP